VRGMDPLWWPAVFVRSSQWLLWLQPILTLRGARQNDRARLTRAASELAPSGLKHASAVFPRLPRSF